jgi:hypothetical protein
MKVGIGRDDAIAQAESFANFFEREGVHGRII